MRAAASVVAILTLMSACAGEKLAVNPPQGVDFSGQWKLNDADSDDPQHLAQVANGTAASNNNNVPQGGRGRGRGGNVAAGTYQGPSPPPVSIMGASLRWPGKALEVKQVAGVVAFTSDGRNRVCQPGTQKRPKQHHHDDDMRDRDSMPSGRDAPPPICGWSERTLVVRGGSDPDEDRAPFEEDYSLSEDSMRLIEVVIFTGGRSNGYTLSRVWDRVR
jgi:hypothetical protein